MTEQPTPVAIARAFTEAWTGHDMETAADYVAEDVVFDGPIAGHTIGAEAYISGLATFAQAVTGVRIIAALGDDTQALIMYEVTTGPFGALTCGEHLTIRDGKIQADRLTFDTYRVRATAAGQPASTGTEVPQ